MTLKNGLFCYSLLNNLLYNLIASNTTSIDKGINRPESSPFALINSKPKAAPKGVATVIIVNMILNTDASSKNLLCIIRRKKKSDERLVSI